MAVGSGSEWGAGEGGGLSRNCGVFRTPSSLTLSPSFADVGSHPPSLLPLPPSLSLPPFPLPPLPLLHRERRLRQFLWHERLSVATSVAEFSHHTLRGQRMARAGEEDPEMNCTTTTNHLPLKPPGQTGSPPRSRSERARPHSW